MIFCVCCFQQANHLNNGISKWEASNITYGSVQLINEKHGLGKTNQYKAWSQNDRHVYECSRMYSDSNIHDIVQLGRLLQAKSLHNSVRQRSAANFQYGSCKAWSQYNRQVYEHTIV